ncbi:hypothetical protein ACFO3K_02130 [Cellulomonas algicola]|uniref:Uncharacterized protein n=1 Tax=Cellulomonas algicola TaxID=2071633 RepID=A0A401V4Q9_9CELL|nr:hypothetical protein [Cellulomonas algicola]GCD21898.1 hypothetical protein CTKZ_34600 [Cellulomonas algicola]
MDEASKPLAAHHWVRTPAIAARLTADREEHRKRRRTAWLVTVAVCGHQALLVGDMVVRATSDSEELRKSAAFVFFLLGVTSILFGLLVWWAWRRVVEVRPVVLPLDATVAEAVGIPELESTPRPHLSLTGQVELPRRW